MAAFLHFLEPFRSRASTKPAPGKPGKKRVGLALSSGAAKGLAHIGVIQVLEENDIEIDVVVGTSMGAYVGGLWSSGLNGRELESLAAEMSSTRKRWELVDPVIPRRGFVGGQNVLARLRRSLDDATFDQLEKSFYCVATELDGYARAVLHEGDVATAILASLAVPGIVVPVERNGIEYIDGGVCDPLPVGVLKTYERVDKIIAVNVMPKVQDTLRHRFQSKRKRRERHPLTRLNQTFNLFAPGNLLDILRGASMGSQMRLVEQSACFADVWIDASSPGIHWHDYHRYISYIEVGRQAAEAALPELLELFEEEDSSSKESCKVKPWKESCA